MTPTRIAKTDGSDLMRKKGSDNVNAASAQAKSKSLGSRCVAVERTAGVRANTNVAVNAAMSETAPFCDSTPSSCMRAAMKDATRTKTMIAEAMPHIGAIRLPPPSSFAKNAISG